MLDAIRQKLDEACERHQELALLMAEPDTANDPDRLRTLSREYSELEDVVRLYRDWRRIQSDLETARELSQSDDAEMSAMAREELPDYEAQSADLERRLQYLLLPRDPNDERNVFLEIRAGTGGHEAALFAGDLLRMYLRYAEKHGWQVELLSERAGEHGGYKEVIARVIGSGAYSHMKFESGTHRVQRVPETESQGRIHTSACTVAILPETDSVDEIELDPNELRIDTFRASGAGGQHVNTTDSAVRITHLPSGIVVECQDERSQHKNRARAMAFLQSKLMQAREEEQAASQAQQRKLQVGSGDRSQRIRTYNFPQGRVTDHRIGLTLYQLDDVLGGALEHVVEPLREADQAQRLEELTSGQKG